MLILREARPIVELTFLLCFPTGAVLTGLHTAGAPTQLTTITAAWVCAVVVIYFLNYIVDIEDVTKTTAILIASSELPRRFAVRSGAILTAAATIGGRVRSRHVSIPSANRRIEIESAPITPSWPPKQLHIASPCRSDSALVAPLDRTE
jgi:hypothetical protein